MNIRTVRKQPILLCFDPGKVNFAWAILDKKGCMIDHGLLNKTFTDLKSGEIILEDNLAIMQLFQTLHEKYPRKRYKFAIVYERYMPRGMFNGNTCEIVNMSLGTLITMFQLSKRVSKLVPTMASTWKAWAKKEDVLMHTNRTLPEHVSDAWRMGLWFLWKTNRIQSEAIGFLLEDYMKIDYGWKLTAKGGKKYAAWERSNG